MTETLAPLSTLLAAGAFEQWRVPLTVGYVVLLLLIGVYGLHRYWLVATFKKHRRDVPRPKSKFEELPLVTVQIPMFNEGSVARRIIDAACELDYPLDRLQVQVIDDSTDDTLDVSREAVEYWQAHGVDIELIHRTDRTGFKAGALANAMPKVKGDYIAMFDADFVPPPSFLRRTIHHFTDPGIGMVQTRWDHLNRNDSTLTRSQAIFLDGHFVIEHTARQRSQRWFNFSGTGGVWRVQAIHDAGGWEHDTLTEDMDLSYRAQLAGWRFVHLPRITCPAELPPEMNAFKSQQHRWTKGQMQTAKKILPAVLRSAAPLKVKIEAFFHLTSPLVYLYINLFVLLFYPAIAANVKGSGTWAGVIFGISMFGMGAMSASVFYLFSQRLLKRGFWVTLLQIPMMMSVGIGIALSNAIACLEAIFGHQSDFVRTPKYNVNSTPRPAKSSSEPKTNMGLGRIVPIPSLKKWVIVLELLMGGYMVWCAIAAAGNPYTVVSLPFIVMFGMGYFYVGLSSLWIHVRTWLESRSLAAQAA
ncbi:MAG: cellulose synthase family protein [Planctomycetota bacterium]